MKIVILVSDFYPNAIGGTEVQTFEIAKRLSKKHNVTVLTRRLKGLPSTEGKHGFVIRRFMYMDYPIIGFLSHVLFSLFEIWKMRKNIDVFQCMMIRPNGVVGALAKKFFGLRYIVWLRSEYRYFGRGTGIARVLSKFALKNADMIITQTESIKEEVLEEYPKKNIRIVNNGVSVSGESAQGENVLFVGNLIERKGVEYLISAVRMLEAEDIRLETVIVGDGILREQLERMAKGLGVSFVGKMSPEKTRKYMKSAKVFVLPSVTGKGEGLPNVVLEAMSYGVPVIASGIAGIPDVIKHGETGFLVNPGDVKSISRYIKILFKNNRTHKRMSEKCLEEIKKYSWKRIIRRIEKIYQEFVGYNE